MAAVRGARDVESLVWFEKYCTKGMGFGKDGVFQTNVAMIYLSKFVYDEENCDECDLQYNNQVEIVGGFEHVLNICGVAHAKFPVFANGNRTQAFKKEDVSKQLPGLSELSTCWSNMCRDYRTFMLTNMDKFSGFHDEDVEIDDNDNKKKLQLFLNTPVVICWLNERDDVNSDQSTNIETSTVSDVLTRIGSERWCCFGLRLIDYSKWNLHMNLCLAWNSSEVVDLADKAYAVLYPDSEMPSRDQYISFSEAMVKLGACKPDGSVSISDLLNKWFGTHVRKCRDSFYNSKYEERLRLMYCMGWKIVSVVHAEDEPAIVKKCALFLQDVVFKLAIRGNKQDVQFTEDFTDLYNEYGKAVDGQGFIPKRKRSRPRIVGSPGSVTVPADDASTDDNDRNVRPKSNGDQNSEFPFLVAQTHNETIGGSAADSDPDLQETVNQTNENTVHENEATLAGRADSACEPGSKPAGQTKNWYEDTNFYHDFNSC